MALTSVISSSNRVPGIYLKVSLGVGARSGAEGTRYVILYGNKLSGGTASTDVETEVFSIDDARGKFGAGSELACMTKAVLGVWPNAPIKAIPVPESGGAQATATITVTGTATRATTLRIWVQGVLKEVEVSNAATPTNIAAAAESVIDGDADLPVTSGAAAGVLTLTANQAGPRGNHIRVRAEVVDAGAGVSVAISGTSTPDVGAYLAGGATSDDPQNALDGTTTLKNTYLVCPYDNVDQTQIAKFVAHVQAEDEPEVGNRKVAICAEVADLVTADNTTVANNEPRLQTAWMESSEWSPAMIASALSALRARYEGEDPAYNFDGVVIPGLPGHLPGTAPQQSELITAVNAGLTPLVTGADGSAAVLKSVTTKHMDGSGNPDYRVHETHRVAVVDRFADDLEVIVADVHGGTRAAASANYPDGPPAGVTTEELVKDTIVRLQRRYQFDLTRLVEVEEHIASTLVDPPVAGRFNASIPLHVIDLFHQFAGDVQQVG